MFDLPAIVPEDIALRCGITTYGETKVEINARVELLKRMRQIERTLASKQNEIGKKMHSLYAQTRSPNRDEWAQITVSDAAKIVSLPAPIDFITRFAIHKYLMLNSKEFVADPLTYRSSQMFEVRPQSHVERLQMVARFSHQKDGPIQSFAVKAKKVIAENQQQAIESWSEPHSEQSRNEEVFTEEDAIIINFLRDSLRVVRLTQLDPYPVNVAAILKATGHYSQDITDSLVCRLLMDLGVMAPWEDMVSSRKELGLDQEAEETSPLVAAQKVIFQKARTKSVTPSRVSGELLGPEDFYSHDLLESIRHDFGNLPVYVIDDARAEELDDGISIEKIPSEPDSAWIHVHIADPTATIPPGHIIAQQARGMVHTTYFGHRTWPMLPRWMMDGLLNSVGEIAALGKPERVMSFSFKVDGTGDIVDYDIRAGIIRNVSRTTYDAVDRALGCHVVHSNYPFGGEPLAPPVKDLHMHQLPDISALKEVTDRMFNRTLQLPIFNVNISKAEVSVSPRPLYTSTVDPRKPPIFRGFPSLTYCVHSAEAQTEGARNIVAQCMTAASRIASRWALDRGVPLLRRSSAQPMTLSDNDFSELLASKDSRGFTDLSLALSKEVINPPAEYTLRPATHWSLGIPDGEGYSRVTSPLRRHSDMVAHWQIKHALLNPTSSKPLFSPEWLRDYGAELIAREKMLRNAQSDHLNFWALRFMQRWRDNPTRPEGPNPLNHMVGYALTGPRVNNIMNDVQTKLVLPVLGLRGFLTGLRSHPHTTFVVGQAHEVAVDEIRLGVKAQLFLKKK